MRILSKGMTCDGLLARWERWLVLLEPHLFTRRGLQEENQRSVTQCHKIFTADVPVDKIPDPGSGSTSKNLSIFNPKLIRTRTKFSKNKIRNVHPRSCLWIFSYAGSWMKGVRKAPDPESAALQFGGSGFHWICRYLIRLHNQLCMTESNVNLKNQAFPGL